ncbi:MAG TPA: hypothetical protein VGK48_06500 [Terriglobia bacterium]|jgi:hypothetical protein
MPLKDSLLPIATKISLTRDDVLALKEIATEHHDENPAFCYTLCIICEHLLDPWAPDKAQALIEPIRLFIHSSENQQEYSVDVANTFARILSSLKN